MPLDQKLCLMIFNTQKISLSSLDERLHLPSLELISIHVEKCAGSSFEQVLREVYGGEMLRIDFHKSRFQVDGMDEIKSKSIFDSVRCIHGHITYEDLQGRLQVPNHCKYISWIRDPAERLASSYSFLLDRMNEYVDQVKSPFLIRKMCKSFTEFIREPLNQNIIARYLSTYPRDHFCFVGNVSNYSEDLDKLVKIMEWKVRGDLPYVNQSKSKKPELNEFILDEIYKRNSDDYKIYAQYQHHQN